MGGSWGSVRTAMAVFGALVVFVVIADWSWVAAAGLAGACLLGYLVRTLRRARAEWRAEAAQQDP